VGWDPADWPAASAAAARPIAARGDGKGIGRWAIAVAGGLLAAVAVFLATAPRPQPIRAGLVVRSAQSLDDLPAWRRDGSNRGEPDEPDGGASEPDNAQPVDAYDGVYSGTATMRADGRPATFTVKVTNGIGSGAVSRLDCGRAAISLKISPTGDVSGMALMFGSTCLKTELAVRGRAAGGTLQLRLGSQYLELSRD
jgi:hypothetical protein